MADTGKNPAKAGRSVGAESLGRGLGGPAGLLRLGARAPSLSSANLGGALNLVVEAIDGALDLHLSGRCSRLYVSLTHDHFCVVDDGPGLEPSEVLDLLETHHKKRTRQGDRAHAHVIGTGMGLAMINALARRLEFELRRAGEVRRWVFEGAVLVSENELVGACDDSGTTLRVWPEASLMREPLPSRAELSAVLEKVHWLCPALRVELDGRRFSGEAGLAAWIRRQPEWDGSPVETLELVDGARGARVGLAWAWLDEPCVARQAAFVNLRETPRGSHVDALLEGLAARYGVSPAMARRRVLALVSVVLEEPRYDSPTREVLAQPELGAWIEASL